MRSRLALFPGGAAGAGLLLLRVSVAVSALMLIGAAALSLDLQIMGVLLAAGLCAGFQTRVLAALSLGASLLSATSLGLGAAHAISALALVLTGPGAFSIDARLFGRRTVTLRNSDDTSV